MSGVPFVIAHHGLIAALFALPPLALLAGLGVLVGADRLRRRDGKR